MIDIAKIKVGDEVTVRVPVMKTPESLATRPNIPCHKQTCAQLIDEYAYWHHKLVHASGWGASLVATSDFQTACEEWLYRLYPEVFIPYWGA